MSPELPESELLSAYLDGECTQLERELVAGNLERDPQWRAALADLQFARDAVRALPPREPPAGFLEGLLVAPESERAASAPARRTLRALKAVSAIAAAVVGLVIVTTPGRNSTPVAPQLSTLSDTHGATATLEADPISSLATVAVPVRFPR